MVGLLAGASLASLRQLFVRVRRLENESEAQPKTLSIEARPKQRRLQGLWLLLDNNVELTLNFNKSKFY